MTTLNAFLKAAFGTMNTTGQDKTREIVRGFAANHAVASKMTKQGK